MSFGITFSPSYDTLTSQKGLFALWSAENAITTSGTIDAIPNSFSNDSPGKTLTKVGATGPSLTAQDPSFNNFPSISSTLANRRLETTFDSSLAQPGTVYLVTTLNTNPGTFFARTNAGNFDASFGLTISSTGSLSIQCANAGPAVTSAAGYIDDLPHVIACIYDGSATSAIYLDNSQTAIASAPGSGSVSSEDSAVVTIGSFGTAINYSWALMAFYSGSHDSYTRFRIMNYLGRKYKISTS